MILFDRRHPALNPTPLLEHQAESRPDGIPSSSATNRGAGKGQVDPGNSGSDSNGVKSNAKGLTHCHAERPS